MLFFYKTKWLCRKKEHSNKGMLNGGDLRLANDTHAVGAPSMCTYENRSHPPLRPLFKKEATKARRKRTAKKNAPLLPNLFGEEQAVNKQHIKHSVKGMRGESLGGRRDPFCMPKVSKTAASSSMIYGVPRGNKVPIIQW